MATMTLHLTETDIDAAIQLWVKAQGFDSQGQTSLSRAEDDRPGVPPSFSATIEVAPQAPIAPAPRRKLGTNGG